MCSQYGREGDRLGALYDILSCDRADIDWDAFFGELYDAYMAGDATDDDVVDVLRYCTLSATTSTSLMTEGDAGRILGMLRRCQVCIELEDVEQDELG
jgi:hypothetical protein